MTFGGVYVILNERTGDFYVGATAGFNRRWLAHRAALRQGKHFNADLQSAWTRDGEKNFLFAMVRLTTPVEAERLERQLLEEFHGTDRCYNRLNSAHVAGDDTREKMRRATTGRTLPPETCDKIAAALTGRVVAPDTCARISNSHRGKTAHNKGKPMSAEQRAKLSAVCKGRPSSMRGKRHSAESVEKFRAARLAWHAAHPGHLKGRPGPKHSEESRAKMRESHRTRLQRQTIAMRGGDLLI